MKKFVALFKARTMEFIRDRGALTWNILFPVLMVFGFAGAFSGNGDSLFTVGVVGGGETPARFADIPGVEFLHYDEGDGNSLETAVNRLRQHQIDMVIDLAREEYYLNSESSSSEILRTLFESTAGANRARTETSTGNAAASTVPEAETTFVERQIAGEPIRYVDWVVPGVIGMNMMFSCLFGVGFVLVRYRKNGVLKRLKATPVSAFTFVSAQVASRVVIVLITSTFVYVGTNAFLQFTMHGSYLLLLLLMTLAVISMIGIGLLFAGRLKSEELAGGLMNLVIFPMIVLSGVFFSLEGASDLVRQISSVLPLTHFVDGARAVMLDGAGLVQLLPNLLVLAGSSLLFLLVSAALFRWE